MNIFWNNSERKRLEARMREEGRLPPGQVATLEWPVLHLGDVPSLDLDSWDLRIVGSVESPLSFSYSDFLALPQVEVAADFHCVTRWSRFNLRWNGVPMRMVLEKARPVPGAHFALVHAEGGYTASFPLPELLREGVLLAHSHDGEALSPEHGFPARLVVPHLYGWKSVKWVRRVELSEHETLGYWEKNGCHRHGNPFREQRRPGDGFNSVRRPDRTRLG